MFDASKKLALKCQQPSYFSVLSAPDGPHVVPMNLAIRVTELLWLPRGVVVPNRKSCFSNQQYRPSQLFLSLYSNCLYSRISLTKYSRGIDVLHKFHTAPVPYPTMYHLQQKCARMLISVTKWCIVGYLSDVLWELWDGFMNWAWHGYENYRSIPWLLMPRLLTPSDHQQPWY